ncbi:MAG: hypothetical protein EBS29_03790 [Chloroflexia bacterium]|nr:hypothetical protein [Chloroflexia bacterium]
MDDTADNGNYLCRRVVECVAFCGVGVIQRRYPLGIAYVSSAFLFPCIVALSAYYGVPVTWRNIAGVVLVMIGVIALVRDVG